MQPGGRPAVALIFHCVSETAVQTADIRVPMWDQPGPLYDE